MHLYRQMSKDCAGAFEPNPKVIEIAGATQELITFVVIRFYPCVEERTRVRPKDCVANCISVLVQCFETIQVTESNDGTRPGFVESPAIR